MIWLKSTHYLKFNYNITKAKSQNYNLNANYLFFNILNCQVDYMLF